ncbi:MAG: hypothetical protein GY749_24210 [Desulfobacteraceae bacterium]|nr:hypothetical protein [Desulfobacteraceae bacterium]
MKIVVLNGSPKGLQSITFQSVKYILKKFPNNEFIFHEISQKIKKIEKNEQYFDQIIDDIKNCDAVLWSFPVYTCFIPAQCVKFIELVNEKNRTEAFNGKFTAAISTSIHFYDHTAHSYINAVCDDLNMKYIGFFSAEMHDLLRSSEREKLIKFGELFFSSIEKNLYRQKVFLPYSGNEFIYTPGETAKQSSVNGKKILIVTDNSTPDSNLDKMTQKFKQSIIEDVEEINLHDINTKGACLGCVQCGYDNTCVYKDDFNSFYDTKFLTSDIIIFAMELKYRLFSYKWKEFFDRRFCKNHSPEMRGKHVGVIVSGPLSQMHHMSEFLNGFLNIQLTDVADIVKDEINDSREIDRSLQNMAENIINHADKNYFEPRNFLGVAGMKIFRDDVWGKLRFVMQADHRYYKANNIYDFPQNRIKERLTNTVIIQLTKVPFFRKKFYKMVKTEMYKPHKNIVDRC